MICSKCNKECGKGAKFCGYCGAELEECLTVNEANEPVSEPSAGNTAADSEAAEIAPIGNPLVENVPIGNVHAENATADNTAAQNVNIAAPVSADTTPATETKTETENLQASSAENVQAYNVPAGNPSVDSVPADNAPADNVRTGGESAAVFCAACGTMLTPGQKFCHNCGRPKAVNAAESTAKKFKKSKKLIAIGTPVAAVVLVLAIVLGIVFSGGSHNYGLYIKDGEILYTEFGKYNQWEVTENLAEDMSDLELESIRHGISGRTRVSEDGKMLFYIDKIEDGGYTLYCRSLDKHKKEPVKLDINVYSYEISADGKTVIYIKSGSLYRHNLKEKEKLAEDVEAFVVSKDCNRIIYTDEHNNLYIKKNDNKKEKIAGNVEGVLSVSKDLKTVYYKNKKNIYKWTEGRESQKLIEDVYSVISVYDSDRLYFVRQTEKEVLAADYINDDLKDSDAAMVEPKYPLPPALKDYASNEDWLVDYDAYLEEMNDYYKLQNEYYNKGIRDEIRAKLNTYKFKLTTSSLYYFDGKKETLIANNYNGSDGYEDVSPKSPAIVYSIFTNDVKAKISNILTVGTIKSSIISCLESSPKIQLAIGGTVQSNEFSLDAVKFYFGPNGDILYYIDEVDGDTGKGTLYSIKIGKTAAKSKVYDTEVDAEEGIYIYSGNEPVYYKDVNSEEYSGTLYINKHKVADNVYFGFVNYDYDNGIYTYFTDYQPDTSSGTLNIRKGNSSTKISDYVYLEGTSITPNGDVMYLYDYSSTRCCGELYLFNGKKSKKIDDDVTAIINANASADIYGFGSINP